MGASYYNGGVSYYNGKGAKQTGIECRVHFLLRVFHLTYATNSGFRHVTASMNSKHTAHHTAHHTHHTAQCKAGF